MFLLFYAKINKIINKKIIFMINSIYIMNNIYYIIKTSMLNYIILGDYIQLYTKLYKPFN